MSELWLLPLGVGAGGAVLALVTVRRLNAAVAGLRESMRPLRVDVSRARRASGTRAP